ncbi:chromosomal replication initiator protein DnaA [Paraburkholderia sp. GV068]|jgi:chromosomal replication initiator protein|uniref:Chromosomal replication initiator protein DnaA n=1 Tax=Paraburkholderia graminis TaxID=60548 RepID=A0ABD5CAG5_9BURK|nr:MULTISPECIES: chromosomal replication initiator protein DnaA [Paraburkholderia]ALE53287.1 chromosomal replication initiation protein [Burkholderia sp. HB1]AXF06462.1 chromosomal replication initiator protein DnaA [Paraburkholderia graminis]MDQ0621252.1 chromosomal replication initiator protein [Paraburkholderia graminis]MDR6202033.1 chromosomal replication initiator protein [Paraburkholderia graminis]MDR6469424.1 chromosomal replication initiator protein [Paraburkholderia graminis]
MNEFWQHCSALLERELTPQQYVTWIKPLAPVAFDAAANTLSIAAPNRFKLDWVKSQFSGRIADMARDFWQAPVDVQFVLDPKAGMRAPAAAAPAAARPASAPNSMGGSAGNAAAVDAAVGAVQAAQATRANGPNSANSAMANLNANARAAAEHNANARAAAEDAADLDLPSLDANEAAAARRTWRPGQSASSNGNGENDSMYERSKLNPVLTFDNFVTGKANQLARAAAIQVADNPGISYNPLFLYGGVGLGKTHLIHAIGNQLLMDKAGARIRYIHAEQYVSDVVKAYQRKAFDDFKRYYHSLDLLLIDDIQFFSGKSRTQEEFFYAFEALVANKAQVIITSDTYPKEISGIDDRLISRFDSGLTVAIEPPELEMRVAILMRKAQSEFVSLNEDVAFFVAKHLRSNVRELEGALRKILAYSKFHGREITIELTKEALKDLLTVQNRQISVENIQKTVADFYSIKVADMYSKKRPANIARPRQIAMYLAKELTQKSLPEIGELFGGRDHTTVLHAVRKIADERSKDAQLNHELHVLEQTLKG